MANAAPYAFNNSSSCKDCEEINRDIYTGVHKTGIRGIQDTRQIVDGKTNDIENNDKKGGYKLLT